MSVVLVIQSEIRHWAQFVNFAVERFGRSRRVFGLGRRNRPKTNPLSTAAVIPFQHSSTLSCGATWTFVDHEGVEPTNNAAERALRPAVLWRRGCFGTQSEAGSRFAERMLTVSTTLQQHQRPLLPFITDAVTAYWTRQPSPSLFNSA